MTTILQSLGDHIRHSNKDPEWQGICGELYDQYGVDDVFGLSPEESALIDLAISPEQSHHNLSHDPFTEQLAAQNSALMAAHNLPREHPKPQESASFWRKAIGKLDLQAARSEKKQARIIKKVQSHPDFLSLGGYPSPSVSQPVPEIPLSVPRSRPREAANGKKTPRNRSVSRGRPQGIAKTTSTTNNNLSSNNQCQTIRRKASQSPSKMMNPSRYRSGWTENIPDNATMRIALTPPSSAQIPQNNLAAFGAAIAPGYMAGYDQQISPLTNGFQRANIQTPDASPFFTQGQSYFDQNGAAATQNAAFPPRTTSLAQNRIGSFDFGFDTVTTGATAWPEQTYDQIPMTTGAEDALAMQQPMMDSGIAVAGLGITCDGTYYPSAQVYPSQVYEPVQQIPTPTRACYAPMTKAEPITPRKQRAEYQPQTPCSPMTEPRNPISGSAAKARRVSKHRRTKSQGQLPRHTLNLDADPFVNYTPGDSNKILSGVAPSGSSKTKARREKEAAEKRRRLSEAAFRIVRDAGGDVSKLDCVGLGISAAKRESLSSKASE